MVFSDAGKRERERENHLTKVGQSNTTATHSLFSPIVVNVSLPLYTN